MTRLLVTHCMLNINLLLITIVLLGPFPLGYASTIQARCNETHQLLVPAPSVPNNLEKIFTDLISFVVCILLVCCKCKD